jgi:hypothetical protein
VHTRSMPSSHSLMIGLDEEGNILSWYFSIDKHHPDVGNDKHKHVLEVAAAGAAERGSCPHRVARSIVYAM